MDDLRETIARAIYENGVAHMAKHCVIPGLNILTWDQMADHPHREVYTTDADAVIAALGLKAQEIEHPKTVFLRRYITDWEKTPTVPLEEA